MTDTESEILTMISSAGESKSLAFQALRKARQGAFDEARSLLAQAKEADLEAHRVQTRMIQEELTRPEADRPALTLLMAHAQDHYMTAQLARDLIEELVEVLAERP